MQDNVTSNFLTQLMLDYQSDSASPEQIHNPTTALESFINSVFLIVDSINLLVDLVFKIVESTLLLFDSIKLSLIPDSFFYSYFFIYLWLVFVSINIVSFFLYPFLGLNGFFYLMGSSLLLFWFSLVFYFNFFFNNSAVRISLGEWVLCGNELVVEFSLYIDKISFSFAFLTVTIATFVYFYTYTYFRYEPNIERLVTLLMLFVNSMVLLVFASNLVILFLGWELIGITSFFLINFWTLRAGTLKSALKAFVYNKFSDICVLSVIILCFVSYNDLEIQTLNNLAPLFQNHHIRLIIFDVKINDIIVLFLILAACVKSAQFGFHLWLPDSMEAPAPASALIHSATLVSSGIYLILRFTPFIELSYLGCYVLPIIGAVTAFFGGFVSAFQTDVKKILAYSTISHCGYMVLLSSTFLTDIVLVYLYVHGFFKALLFLTAGNIMRFFGGEQDFRYMGGAWKYLPLECCLSLFCFWHLSGGPFSFGYVAKHFIVIGLDAHSVIFSTFIYINIILGVLSSVIYSYRFYYYIFFDFKKAKKPVYTSVSNKWLFSKYYTNSSISACNLLVINYLVALLVCFILIYRLKIHRFENDFFVNSDVMYDSSNMSLDRILTLVELEKTGRATVSPVLVINMASFSFFLLTIFCNYRSTLYPEQDLTVLMLVILSLFGVCWLLHYLPYINLPFGIILY